MARVNGAPISGKVGELVYYNRGGKTFVRPVPKKVRQSKATKKTASVFGQANRIASALRKPLLPFIAGPAEKNLHIRFTSAVSSWLRSGGPKGPTRSNKLSFEHFDLVEKSPLFKRWLPRWEINASSKGTVEILLPAFRPVKSIMAPTGTASVICTIVSAACWMEGGFPTGSASQELSFPYDNVEIGAQTLSLKLPASKGSIVITAVSLRFLVKKNGNLQTSTAKGYLPVSLVSAMYI